MPGYCFRVVSEAFLFLGQEKLLPHMWSISLGLVCALSETSFAFGCAEDQTH